MEIGKPERIHEIQLDPHEAPRPQRLDDPSPEPKEAPIRETPVTVPEREKVGV